MLDVHTQYDVFALIGEFPSVSQRRTPLIGWVGSASSQLRLPARDHGVAFRLAAERRRAAGSRNALIAFARGVAHELPAMRVGCVSGDAGRLRCRTRHAVRADPTRPTPHTPLRNRPRHRLLRPRQVIPGACLRVPDSPPRRRRSVHTRTRPSGPSASPLQPRDPIPVQPENTSTLAKRSHWLSSLLCRDTARTPSDLLMAGGIVITPWSNVQAAEQAPHLPAGPAQVAGPLLRSLHSNR